MSRQGEPNIVRGARVKHMKQDALSGAHADRLAMTKRFIVERCSSIHNFHAVVRRRPFSYVLHADEFRIPLMRREKNFLVIAPWIVFRFDVTEAKLTGI